MTTTWDPANNVDQDVTVGEFTVHHFKGIPGHWDRRPDHAGEFRPYGDGTVQEYWTVSLPHQCDEWEITRRGDTHAEAVAALEVFAADAQRALQELRRLGHVVGGAA